MVNATADRVAIGFPAQMALRLLITSYLVAATFGAIAGPDFTALLPVAALESYKGGIALVVVAALSLMVITDTSARLAALALAVMTLVAGYVTVLGTDPQATIAGFWRDLVLVAALLLTYCEPQTGSRKNRRVVRRKIEPRRITQPSPSQDARPTRPVLISDTPKMPAPAARTEPEAEETKAAVVQPTRISPQAKDSALILTQAVDFTTRRRTGGAAGN